MKRGEGKTGGYRGGTKPGEIRGPYAKTISKEEGRAILRELVMAELKPMVRAQVAHAKGIGHVMVRDQAGKFSRITSEEHALELLTTGTEGTDYWIFMKDPSTAAFTDLLNRALDKPVEPTTIEHTGNLTVTWKKAT